MNVLRPLASVLASAAVVAACVPPGASDDDDEPMGPIVSDGGVEASFTPTPCVFERACGGQVIGRWRFVSGCQMGEDLALVEDCPFAAFEQVDNVRGELVFGIEGLYTLALSNAPAGQISLPGACFEGQEVPSDEACKAVGAGLGTTSTCRVDQGAGCHCTFSNAPTPLRTEMGQYAASGSQILLQQLTFEYCIMGDTMWLLSPENEGLRNVFTLKREASL